jgi:FkbM family methyltransferase
MTLRSFVGRLRGDGHSDALTEQVLARLDESAARQNGEVASLRHELASLHNDIWASKVVRIGDRLLVGSRHLNLVFYIEADDKLIGPRLMVEGEYEPATTAFVKRVVTPDSTCIDVGANFGYYACMMGHLAWKGRTISFEADPATYRLLIDNIAINWCEGPVEARNVAVAAEAGELTLHRWINRSGNTGIIPPSREIAPGVRVDSQEFTVPAVTLDSLVGTVAQVDLVKIDVEGAETLVVAGMGELVRTYRPTVVLEWSPSQMVAAGSKPEELADRLAAWGIPVYTIDFDGRLRPLEVDQLAELPYQNIVLQPPERSG